MGFLSQRFPTHLVEKTLVAEKGGWGGLPNDGGAKVDATLGPSQLR